MQDVLGQATSQTPGSGVGIQLHPQNMGSQQFRVAEIVKGNVKISRVRSIRPQCYELPRHKNFASLKPRSWSAPRFDKVEFR